MNIVIVGARAFPIIKAGVAVCDLLASFSPEKDLIHTRGGERGPDAFVAEAAGVMGFKVRRWPAEGGASNFVRDVEMVKAADVVYAMFEADHVGEGGTQHVVEKSLDQHKRTYSYTWTDRGGLTLIGTDDGAGIAGHDEATVDGEAAVSREDASERAKYRSQSPEERGRPVWPGMVEHGDPDAR
jgi:hypothetical protein